CMSGRGSNRAWRGRGALPLPPLAGGGWEGGGARWHCCWGCPHPRPPPQAGEGGVWAGGGWLGGGATGHGGGGVRCPSPRLGGGGWEGGQCQMALLLACPHPRPPPASGEGVERLE